MTSLYCKFKQARASQDDTFVKTLMDIVRSCFVSLIIYTFTLNLNYVLVPVVKHCLEKVLLEGISLIHRWGSNT